MHLFKRHFSCRRKWGFFEEYYYRKKNNKKTYEVYYLMESEVIKTLRKELIKGNENAITHFWEMIMAKGSPLVEGIDGDQENVLITFIWKDHPDLKSVSVYGPFPGGDISQNQLQRLHDTDVWYKSYITKNNVLSHYFYTLNDSYGDNWEERWRNFENDPYNKKTFVFPKNEEMPDDVEKAASILELPLTEPQQWVEEMQSVGKGEVIQTRFYSQLLNNERRIWVYTPYEYNKNIDYPLVLIFDGDMYNGAISAPTILDNLISNGKIPPVIAVLIDNPQRDIELPCNSLYVDFLTNELLPDLREKYSVTTDPERIVVGGSSYGGLAATYAGFKRPDIFGNILSQSGSFWWKPKEEYEGYWLVDQFEKEQKHPLKIYMDVGIYEIEIMTQSNREMHNLLKAKGYNLQYVEFSGGHDYLCWRGTLSNGLIFLLGEKN